MTSNTATPELPPLLPDSLYVAMRAYRMANWGDGPEYAKLYEAIRDYALAAIAADRAANSLAEPVAWQLRSKEGWAEAHQTAEPSEAQKSNARLRDEEWHPLYLNPAHPVETGSTLSEPAIVWPKSNSVKRRDDMSASDTLQVGIDESGDLQVSLWTDQGYSSVEFCTGGGNGGGKSPNTRLALIALMVAMEADSTKSTKQSTGATAP